MYAPRYKAQHKRICIYNDSGILQWIRPLHFFLMKKVPRSKSPMENLMTDISSQQRNCTEVETWSLCIHLYASLGSLHHLMEVSAKLGVYFGSILQADESLSFNRLTHFRVQQAILSSKTNEVCIFQEILNLVFLSKSFKILQRYLSLTS